jgi:hypothetical protein
MGILECRYMLRHPQTPVGAPKTLGKRISSPVVQEVGGYVAAGLEDVLELGYDRLARVRIKGAGNSVALRSCDDVRSVFARGFGAVVVCEG